MAKLNTESAQAKTAGDMRTHNVRMEMLKFVERFERLQEERDALGDDQKEVMEEAKSMGFDTKVLRMVIRRRKADSAAVSETDALLELYEDTIRLAEKDQTAASLAEAGAPKTRNQKIGVAKTSANESAKPEQMDVEDIAPATQTAPETSAKTWPDDAQVAEPAADAMEPPAFLRRAKV